MKPTSFFSATALAAILNGLIISGNDLAIGIKSSVPIASGVIALIFVAFGLFVWEVGVQLRRVGNEVLVGSPAFFQLYVFAPPSSSGHINA